MISCCFLFKLFEILGGGGGWVIIFFKPQGNFPHYQMWVTGHLAKGKSALGKLAGYKFYQSMLYRNRVDVEVVIE